MGQDESIAYQALFSHDSLQCLEGVQFFRKYVCGGYFINLEGSELRASSVISWNILGRIIWFLQPEVPNALMVTLIYLV